MPIGAMAAQPIAAASDVVSGGEVARLKRSKPAPP
jgi:hypothetical protein